jgi:four helix bundle protein
MMKSDFHDLDVWEKGRELRKEIWVLCKKLHSEERFRLSDQMIRASRSITADVAKVMGGSIIRKIFNSVGNREVLRMK